MTIHSIFDASAGNPATVARFDDGDPSIILANGFYLFGTADGWFCTGGKVYIPDTTGVTSITMALWETLPPDLGGVPARSGVIAAPVVGWNEANWDEYEMSTGVGIYISYTCGNDVYFAGTLPSADAVVSHDGVDLALAEGPFPRGYFKIGIDATSGSNTYYGTDIIVNTESGGGVDPILLGTGSISDQIMAGLISQGFTAGSISDRERARLLAKLVLSEPQPLSLSDLYRLAGEDNRLT